MGVPIGYTVAGFIAALAFLALLWLFWWLTDYSIETPEED